MLLLLDAMAKRYSVMPSKLIESGDTFDLLVFDVAMNYEIIQNAKNSKKPLDQAMLTRTVDKDKLEHLKQKYYGHKDKSNN